MYQSLTSLSISLVFSLQISQTSYCYFICIMNMESSQMKLSNQRDVHRVRIRKEQINKKLQNLRMKYNPSIEAYLMDIDCPETMHNLVEMADVKLPMDELDNAVDRLNFSDFLERLEKCIRDIWTYASSDRNDHIYGFFDQSVVDILIDRLYQCLMFKNHDHKSTINEIKKKILWILVNYTGTGGSIVSEHLVLTLMDLLKSNQNIHQTELVLTFLGNLSDNPNYKNIMINSGILKQLTSNRYTAPDHIFALMKIMDNIDYRLFCQYLDRTLQIATQILFSSSDITTITNILQIFSNIINQQNISLNIRLIVGNYKQIQAIHLWILDEQLRRIKQQQFLKILHKAIAILIPIYNSPFASQQDQQLAVECIMKHFYDKAIKIVLMGLQHENRRVKQKSSYLLQCMCCQTEICQMVMQNERTLISQMMQCLMSTYRQPQDRPIISQSFVIRKSYLLTLCNICLSTGENEIKALIHRGIIQIFANILYEFEDNQINLKILKALKSIFKIGRYLQQEEETELNYYVRDFGEAGGIRKLYQTSEHNNEKVAKLAEKILDRYCRLEKDDRLTQ